MTIYNGGWSHRFLLTLQKFMPRMGWQAIPMSIYSCSSRELQNY